jgi:hypothetical protein
MKLTCNVYVLKDAYPSLDLEGWAYEYWIYLDNGSQIAYFSSVTMSDDYPLSEAECELALDIVLEQINQGIIPEGVEEISA